ncbi:hypothetical protein Tco_0365421 [Tanacetum coccineum]
MGKAIVKLSQKYLFIVKEFGMVFENGGIWFCLDSEEEENLSRNKVKQSSGEREHQWKNNKSYTLEAAKTLSKYGQVSSTGNEQVSTVGAKKSTSDQDKGQREGKAPMISEETPKKSKEQVLQEEASLAEAIRLDTQQREEVAKQVHLDSLLAQRIAEEEELNEQQKKRKAQVQFEAQHYTNEDWDLIRAKLEANAELSKSMLGSEVQGEDFAKKMVDLVNQRKKYFAEERARAKRNKPMTQSQLKTYMMNYLKNQGTWKLSQLKNLSFEEIKKEFDKLVKQVESFAPISFEATKASLKRFGEELQTKTPKRMKDDKDDEAKDDEQTKKSGKRRKQMARKGLHTSVDKDDSEDSDGVGEQEESVTGTKTPINPVPVSMKTPSIATYKIIKQGEKGAYQIVREDGTDIVYINFGAMLKSISRDDLTELYRIVMNRYGMNGPEDKLEKGFWKCLRIMFEEPLSTDSIWSELGQQKIISWRYYDTCRATVKVKTINGEVQLQALVDGKKILVTEASVIRDLQLNDEEGTNCLPNDTIFEELTRMGAKTTAWNEFSITMASAIICLATNQKFNLSKYIFESMVKNLDNAGKFLMYPRIICLATNQKFNFLDKQLEEMSSHKRIYVTPSHTKKTFGNMRRVGKGYPGRETPLFPTMVVQNQADMGEGSAIPNNVADEAVNEEMDDSLERGSTTATSLDAEHDSGNIDKTQSKATPNEPSSLETSSGGGPRIDGIMYQLANRVIDLENTKTAQAQEITSLKLRVKKLEKKRGSRTHKLKRLYKVGRSTRIVSYDEASLGDQEDASKQRRKIDDIDKDTKITLVDETQGRYGDDIMFDVSDLAGEEVFIAEQGVSDKDVNLSVDEVTLAQALAALKTAITRPKAKGLVIHEQEQAPTPIVSLQQPSQAKIQDKGWKPKDLKSKSFANIQELVDKAMKRVNTFVDYRTKLVEGSSEKAEAEIAQKSSSKRAGDELERESIKKQKMDKDKETAELKSLMEVIPDEEEVAVDAIPLATKPPSIVE